MARLRVRPTFPASRTFFSSAAGCDFRLEWPISFFPEFFVFDAISVVHYYR